MFSANIQSVIVGITAIVLIAFGCGVALCYYLDHHNKPKSEEW